ncbi:hypothetical protein FRB97_005883 [Tulasnella sp. 331]|nr:hypothetical protein FRB97_005883 [Tulasnella sp. 331]
MFVPGDVSFPLCRYIWLNPLSNIEGKYHGKPEKLSVGLDAQATAYKQAVELGIEQAKGGSRVAHSIVYMLDQLIAGTTPSEEMGDLLEGLSFKTKKLYETSQKLQDKFYDIRGALMQVSKDSLPRLKDEIEGDKASNGKRSRISAFTALGCIFFGLAYPPLLLSEATSILLIPLPPTAAAASPSIGAGIVYKRRQLKAESALDVLNHLASGLDAAITIIGKHVDFWHKLHSDIEAALEDQSEFIGEMGLPSVALAKPHRNEWLQLEKQFDGYGSLALTSKQILEMAST